MISCKPMTSSEVAKSGSASVTQSTAASTKMPLMNAASRGSGGEGEEGEGHTARGAAAAQKSLEIGGRISRSWTYHLGARRRGVHLLDEVVTTSET